MTLFHLREFWSTNCGNDEEFDKTLLCVSNIDNASDGSDKIVVASLNGVLRVFKVNLNEDDKNEQNHYQASDLLLEMDFKIPILQIFSGLLIASNNTQLAILHPQKLCVYSISSTSGVTEHGTSYNMLLIYELNFEYKAVSMLMGSFGQFQGKDLICVLDTESTLHFYENESLTFSYNWNRTSSKRFPMELAYIANRDLIVIVNDLFDINCYRYQEFAMEDSDFKTSGSHQNVASEWCYLFGEYVIDLCTVLLDTKWLIIVLGERNLCVLRENGSLFFIKKFDVNPSCFIAFANDSKDSLVIVVGTHLNNLLIYQNDILKWTAKTSFVPVSIKRGHFSEIQGSMILLSDDGHLNVSYLGTNPSLKIISMPSGINDEINFEQMDHELKKYKKLINFEANRTKDKENQIENLINANILKFEPKNLPNTFHIVLELLTQTNLKNVKFLFYGNDFFTISPNEQILKEFNEPLVLGFIIEQNQLYVPLSTNIQIGFLFKKENSLRIISKKIDLFLENFTKRIHPSMMPKVNQYKIETNIENNDNRIMLSKLFNFPLDHEFDKNSIVFSYKECQTSIKTNDDNSIFWIESNEFPLLYLAIKELSKRIKLKTNCKNIFKSFALNFHPIEFLCSRIKSRLMTKNLLWKHKEELAKLSQHYRVLQKRILVKSKDKTPSPLDNLDKLLKVIRIKINKNIETIINLNAILQNENYNVLVCLKTLKLFLKKTKLKEDKTLNKFIKLISLKQLQNFTMNWEESLESSLLEILNLNTNIANWSKILEIENNLMQNSSNLSQTLNKIFKIFSDSNLVSVKVNNM